MLLLFTSEGKATGSDICIPHVVHIHPSVRPSLPRTLLFCCVVFCAVCGDRANEASSAIIVSPPLSLAQSVARSVALPASLP